MKEITTGGILVLKDSTPDEPVTLVKPVAGNNFNYFTYMMIYRAETQR